MELLEMHWMDEFQVNDSWYKIATNVKAQIRVVWQLEFKYI